jgi:hypothetical protein
MGNTTKIYGRLQSDAYAGKGKQLLEVRNTGEVICSGVEIETTATDSDDKIATTAAIMAWVTANFVAQ